AEDDLSSIYEIDVQKGTKTAILGPAVALPETETPAPGGEPTTADGEPTEPETDEHNASGFEYPTISPDGRYLAVQASDHDNPPHVGLFDLTRRTYRELVSGHVRRLAFSPDGTMLAANTRYTKSKDDPYGDDLEIAVIDVDSGDVRVLTFNSHKDTLAGWSRDSTRIYYTYGSRDPDDRAWDNRIYWVAAAGE
ncbi:MAG: hypothetical protein QF464_18575, partial [Myxococcota bacterium]|nr:hypothetical protein [Myxococcota bacterium]